jgi:cytochrome P450
MRHWFSDVLPFRRDSLAFFTDMGRTSREPLRPLKMGFAPVFLVTDPELTKPIFSVPEEEIDKGRLIYKLRQIMGDSSFTLSGPRHRERRAAMHAQLARGLATSIAPSISALLRRYAAALATEPDFDAHRATAPLALRIISLLLFGADALTPGDEALMVEAVNLIEDDLAAGIFQVLPDLPWVRARKKRKLAEGTAMMNLVVARARRNAKKNTLIRALEELHLSEKELNHEILLLFLAGHHTSGTAMAWLLYYLAIDPALRDAVAREAASISDESGEFNPQSLSRTPITTAAAREVLRLYPPAYWLSREVKKPVTIAGRRLSAGTSLLVSPWHMHRDPRFWTEPESFRLDRDHLRNPAWTPFGVGPRVCVGMGVAMLELQLLALEFAAAFEMEVKSEVPPPAPTPRVTIVPPEIRIALRPRQLSTRLDLPSSEKRSDGHECPYARQVKRPAAA